MQIFENFNGQSFKLNSRKYVKNFIVMPSGLEHITVYNGYDTRLQLLSSTHYSEITVNGLTYQNQLELMNALTPILFAKAIVSDESVENKIISLGVINRSENVFYITSPPINEWRISNIIYSSNTYFSFVIDYEESGYRRIDSLILTVQGFELIQGEPYSDIITSPTLPDDSILVKEFRVDGDYIDEGDPHIYDIFVSKGYYAQYNSQFSGVQDAPSYMMPFGIIRFVGTCSELKSLNIVYVPAGNQVFGGHEIVFKNSQATPVLIKNMSGSGNFKFWFPDGLDYLVQPNEIIKFTIHYALYRLEFLSSNIPKSTITTQKTITSNATLDSSYNNCIVKIKTNSTIIIPTGLIKEFSCVFRTYAGATATFVNGSGVIIDAPKGKILEPYRMATLFKDGSLETYILEGELII